MIQIVAAIARNGVIGKEGKIPWRLPADLKRFKALTMGHVLIMGRKTYESIGRPLPGRTTIVVSRGGFVAPDGVYLATSVESAIALADQVPLSEIFVVGGAEIYKAVLPIADRLHLTQIDANFDGDVSFPKWEQQVFELSSSEHCKGDSFNYEFQTWDRK